MKICMVDIETTGFDANFGRVLCVSFKPLGEKPFTISQLDWPDRFKTHPWDDGLVVAKAMDIIKQYDVIVTYYGKRFDIPFLRSRLFKAGKSKQRDPMMKFHLDLYFYAKFQLSLSRRSMENVGRLLDCKSPKVHPGPNIWLEAGGGNKKAFSEIHKRCEGDVILLEDIYHAVSPYLKSMTRVMI